MNWNEDSDKHEKLAENINKLLGSVSTRQKLLRFLYICIGLNLLIWISIVLFPVDVYYAFSRVHEMNDKMSKVVLAIPFTLEMAITYLIFRFKFPDIEEQNLGSEVMGSYAYQADSQKRWLVWLFSTVGGVLNLLLVILATFHFGGEQ